MFIAFASNPDPAPFAGSTNLECAGLAALWPVSPPLNCESSCSPAINLPGKTNANVGQSAARPAHSKLVDPSNGARSLGNVPILLRYYDSQAFLMTLKPGNQEEYAKRHNPIWPELQAVLKDHGVSKYSIFLDRSTDLLFAYAEVESEELWQQIAETEPCHRWWAHMKDLMRLIRTTVRWRSRCWKSFTLNELLGPTPVRRRSEALLIWSALAWQRFGPPSGGLPGRNRFAREPA